MKDYSFAKTYGIWALFSLHFVFTSESFAAVVEAKAVGLVFTESIELPEQDQEAGWGVQGQIQLYPQTWRFVDVEISGLEGEIDAVKLLWKGIHYKPTASHWEVRFPLGVRRHFQVPQVFGFEPPREWHSFGFEFDWQLDEGFVQAFWLSSSPEDSTLSFAIDSFQAELEYRSMSEYGLRGQVSVSPRYEITFFLANLDAGDVQFSFAGAEESLTTKRLQALQVGLTAHIAPHWQAALGFQRALGEADRRQRLLATGSPSRLDFENAVTISIATTSREETSDHVESE